MPFDFKTGVSNVNDLLFPGSKQGSAGRLNVFGGETNNFAAEIGQLYNNMSNRAVADGFSVAKGMVDPIPRSLFNDYALFNYRGMYGDFIGTKPFSDYIDGTSKPNDLMGGDLAKRVSVAKIIQFYEEVYPKIRYKAQDFLYGKYYKKIPVNHLITLRRFPVPVVDNIFDYTVQEAPKDPDTNIAANKYDGTQVAGVTAVTYLGETAGNKLDDLLSFSFGLNWKELTSEMEKIESNTKDYTNQPFYSKMGGIGRGFTDALRGVDSGTKFRKANAQGALDKLNTTYANFVLGPINVVNRTTIRDVGINFANDLKLSFEYELRSLNYVNPKIAMIDIMSNMLTMTTNNGQFFGGGHRFYGGAGFVSSQFGDPKKLKNGDFSGYIGSVVSDVSNGFQNLFGNSSGGFDVKSLLEGGLTAGKTILGNVLGGFLSGSVGAISDTQFTKAIISGEPTGDWHVTIGNPLNPIVMMGNMYCENASMIFGGGLGWDDFPMEVKFEIDMKHGKPRDKGDIENMFNAGRGRIYAAAANEEDILNLAGIESPTVGNLDIGGNVSLQNTQAQSNNASPASSYNATNIEGKNTKKSGSATADDLGNYTSNLVAMIVES